MNATATAPVRHRMNMNWASGAFYEIEHPLPPAGPTEFEQMVQRVGLEKRPDLWADNPRLCRFAATHRKTRYVPEWFLSALGFSVDVEV